MKILKTLCSIVLCAMSMTAFAEDYIVIQKYDGKNVEIPLHEIEQVFYTNYEHNFVDLGLPSGTLWAECNLGALKPYEAGGYYRWGATEPGGPYNGTWWLSSTPFEEMLAKGVVNEDCILTPEYDAATVNWGKDWAMPTPTQMHELFYYCTQEDVEVEGMNCLKLTGLNGNSILIPRAGRWTPRNEVDFSFIDYGRIYFLWTSAAFTEGGGWISVAQGCYGYAGKCDGYNIRPVVKHVDYVE